MLCPILLRIISRQVTCISYIRTSFVSKGLYGKQSQTHSVGFGGAGWVEVSGHFLDDNLSECLLFYV